MPNAVSRVIQLHGSLSSAECMASVRWPPVAREVLRSSWGVLEHFGWKSVFAWCWRSRSQARWCRHQSRRQICSGNRTPSLATLSPNVKLELLEAAVVHAAPRTSTHAAIALVFDQSLHTGPTQPAYAICTCVTLFQRVETPTSCAVYLHRLSWGEHG